MFRKNINDLVAYSLTIISLFLWVYAIDGCSLNIGCFGLINSLPGSYFLGLSFLVVSFIYNLFAARNKTIANIQIVILIIFLFLTPLIIEPYPRFRSSYKVIGFAEFILRNSYIDPFSIWYHSWPGVPILLSVVFNFFGESNVTIVHKYFPFAIQLLYYVCIYNIVSYIYRDFQRKYISIYIFFILNFVNQDYISPQAFAYLLYLNIFFIILVGLTGEGSYFSKPSISATLFILLASLMTTHFLTSVLFVSIISISVAINLISSTRLIPIKLRVFFSFNRFSLNMLFISLILLMFWMFYGAATYMEFHLDYYIQRAFDFESLLHQNIDKRVAGSDCHILISRIMVIVTVSSFFLSSIGLFSLLVNSNDHSRKKIAGFLLIVIVATLPVTLISPYGGEMFIRNFLFLLPVVAILVAHNYLGKLRYILILFIIIITPLHILMHYGNEQYDYISAGEFISFNHLYEKCDVKYISGGTPIQWPKYQERYNTINFNKLAWIGNEYLLSSDDYIILPNHCIIISRGDKARYHIFFNDTDYIYDIDINLRNSKKYLKIYDNFDNQFYLYSV